MHIYFLTSGWVKIQHQIYNIYEYHLCERHQAKPLTTDTMHFEPAYGKRQETTSMQGSILTTQFGEAGTKQINFKLTRWEIPL